MKKCSKAVLFVFLLVASFASYSFGSDHPQHHPGGGSAGGQARAPGDFDYYLLALSWSPEFCASPAGHKPEKKSQCDQHFGFVIHGLWPQLRKGGYPESCAPSTPVDPESVKVAMSGDLRIPPGDAAFVQHEWDKHGTCTGLSQADYFKKEADAAGEIVIPDDLKNPTAPLSISSDQVKTLFTNSNPEIQAKDLEVIVDGQGQYSEIHICLSKTLEYTSCEGLADKSVKGVFLPVSAN